tara:strand:- start:139 stop:342 length:204 start_codon:yes stop_codon:yes gene_type:complete
MLVDTCNKMTPIKKIIAPYVSIRAAALRFNVADVQLKRLADKDALVDEYGQVYIKSKTILKLENNNE